MADDLAPNAPTKVELHNVARRFGRRWALAGVSLTIPAGSSHMLLGPNGSGKTTLLRCISTSLRPHQGRIEVGGRDAWTERTHVRQHTASLPHALHLYGNLSARDNLMVWARLARLDVDTDALLERVGLPVDRDDPIRALSAGMCRRLAIARLLLKRPRLLLLDEPFSALDPQGRALMRDVILQIRRQGATILMATHLPDLAMPCCDGAVLLNEGLVRWSGPSADLPRDASP